jgi:hypothetical protein
VKLSTGDLPPPVLFSSFEFYKNHCSESHVALTDLNEMMPVFSAFFNQFGKNSVRVGSGAIHGEPVCFVKISAVKAILYLMMLMNFCPYFSSLLSDFGEFFYRRCACSAVEGLWILC